MGSEKVHLDTAPDFNIRDENVHVSFGGIEVAAMSLRVFRACHNKAAKALAEYDRELANLIPFRKEYPSEG